MRIHNFRLAAAALTLAACGLDIVGSGGDNLTSPPDASLDGRASDGAGDEASRDTGSDEGSTPVDAATDAAADADARPDASTDAGTGTDTGSNDGGDAGPVVILGSGFTGLRSIAVSPDAVYVAGNGAVELIALPFVAGASRQTLSYIQNARALNWSEEGLIFVGPDDIGYYRNGVAKSTRTGEPAGSDVLYVNSGATARVLGSFVDRVTSYMPPNSGDVRQLSADTNPGPLGLASDGVFAYWADRPRNFIGKSTVTIAGGNFVTATAPTSVALEGNTLFIATDTAIVSTDKLVPTVPLTPVVTGLGHPVSLFGDGAYLYWIDADNGSFKRAAKTGGVAMVLATGGSFTDFSITRLIATDATYVYWANPTDKNVSRLPK